MEFAKKLKQRSADIYGTKPISIAFLGDSVTQGCFECYPLPDGGMDTLYDAQNVYHAKLKTLFNTVFPNVPVNILNAGISGDNAQNGLLRLERDVLVYHPDLVVVCFGLNDAGGGMPGLDAYGQALRGIFKRLKEESTEVLFMTPNMMADRVNRQVTDETMKKITADTVQRQTAGVMDAYMERACTVCSEEQVPVCDCYKKWKTLAQNGADISALLANYINHPAKDMHWLFAYSLFEKMIME